MGDENVKAVAKGFAGCSLGAVAIVALAVEVLTNGIAIAVLWNWFVVSLFGLPRLDIFSGYGLSLVVHSMSPSNELRGMLSSEDTSARALVNWLVLHLFVEPAAMVFMGLVVKYLAGM